MPANIDSIAYYGEMPWHKLGVSVPKAISSNRMIEAAGLNWEVDMRPARGAKINNKTGTANRYEIVRLPRHDQEEEIVFGIVSGRYTPLQNKEAFEFFDPIVEDGDAYYETAGALNQGESVWVLARMPGAMEIAKDDYCLRYLLFSNTHDGKGSITVKFTPMRVVCQNTLMLAMEDGRKAFRVRHSNRTRERLDEVAEILTIAKRLFSQNTELFRSIAKKRIVSAALYDYLELVYPRTKKQKQANKTPDKWAAVIQLFENDPTLQLPGVTGTLWAAYNAVTQFEDYRTPDSKEENPDNRLERVWFGSGADRKLQALDAAKELLAA